jgi:hypothetical protein
MSGPFAQMPSRDELLRDTPVTMAVLAAWVATMLFGFTGLPAWLAFDIDHPITRFTGFFTHGFRSPGGLDPVGIMFLLMAGFTLFQFGCALERTWYSRTYLLFLLLTNAVSMAVWLLGCLLVRAVLPAAQVPLAGAFPWILLTNVLVAWSWVNPHQKVMLLYVIPADGRWMGVAAMVITVLFEAIGVLRQGQSWMVYAMLSPFTLGGSLAAILYVNYREKWWWMFKPRARASRRPASRR